LLFLIRIEGYSTDTTCEVSSARPLKESQGFDMGRSFKDTQRKEGKFVCKGSKLEELICKTKQIEASDLVVLMCLKKKK
jgi:hypothetical protein